MKPTNTTTSALAAALIATVATLPQAQAVTISHRGNSVDIDFVDINYNGTAAEDAGDPANTVNGANPGVVTYDYSIGQYEVTAAQWATVTSYDANIDTGIYSDPWSGSQPTANVSWYEAAKFANWLTSGNALQGAYQFSDATTFTGVDRDAALATYMTIYVLPSEDEWYKAAYLKSDGSGYTTYATGNALPDGIDFSGDTNYDYVYRDASNFNNGGTLAVGGGTIENNGTYDMGGNVFEWCESAFDGTLDDLSESRVIRGGAWFYGFDLLWSSNRNWGSPDVVELRDIGFRVASLGESLGESGGGSGGLSVVPEPSSVGLLVIGAMGCVMRRKRG